MWMGTCEPGQFHLLAWVFLNMCPEAAVINPFLESKQTQREGETARCSGNASRGRGSDTGKTSGPEGGKESWQELECQPGRPSLSHPLLLQQEISQTAPLFCLDSRDVAYESSTQSSTLYWKAYNPSICSQPEGT